MRFWLCYAAFVLFCLGLACWLFNELADAKAEGLREGIKWANDHRV